MGPNGRKYEKIVLKGADLAAAQVTKQQLKPKDPKVGVVKPQQGELQQDELPQGGVQQGGLQQGGLQQGKSFSSHFRVVWR